MSAQDHHLLVPILIAFSLIIPSNSAGIAVYWGQQTPEGTLREACRTSLYQYVNIAYLYKFGNGTFPEINLAGHCNSGACQGMSSDIKYCQSLGVKVLLSLQGANNFLNSSDDAKQVAAYLYKSFLWESYLRPQIFRPFGDAVLDGIDFDVSGGVWNQHWDDLAKALDRYRSSKRPIFLSAAPQCFHPDANLNLAIQTGVFNCVWIKFYNNPPCDYSGGSDGLQASWKWWSKNVPSPGKIFLGLPADPRAVSSGYISPRDLETQILPNIKSSPNYGGLMLWHRYYDKINQYSANLTEIKINDQGLHYSE